MSQPNYIDWLNGKIIPIYMQNTRDLLQTQGHKQTESKGMEKVFYANGNQNKAGIAILISDKIYFKLKTVTRNKRYHLVIKGSVQE